MGSCGCSSNPNETIIIKTPKGDYVQVSIWRKRCDTCDLDPMVQFGCISKSDAKEEIENGANLKESVPMFGDAFFALEDAEKEIAFCSDCAHPMSDHTPNGACVRCLLIAETKPDYLSLCLPVVEVA